MLASLTSMHLESNLSRFGNPPRFTQLGNRSSVRFRTEEPWLAGDHAWTPNEVKFFGTDTLLHCTEIFDVDAVYGRVQSHRVVIGVQTKPLTTHVLLKDATDA